MTHQLPIRPAERLRIVSAQLNPVVGDIAGNLEKARAALAAAAAQAADLVVLSEMFLLGYPAEDLVLKPAALVDCRRALEALAAETRADGPAMLVGLPWAADAGVMNAVALAAGGRVEAVRFKRELPNYAVFDEKRVFAQGPLPEPVPVRGVRLGVAICEDIWRPDVAAALKAGGAELLVAINGSPWRRSAADERRAVARARVAETGLPLIYVNQFGGQDELCFDGGGFALSDDGTEVQSLPAFRETCALAQWVRAADGRWMCASAERVPAPDGLEADYSAALCALRDYVDKNRFPGVLIGLSGGVDSALSAAMAVDALGPERVRVVMMPSRHTSQASLDDAAACAAALGLTCETVSIEPAMAAFAAMLAPLTAGADTALADENVQSRARAVTLMALSNTFGHMVLTTGNKSEMAVGYATLYGDMCGGYNALKDFYKTEIYDLCRWRNANRPDGALGPLGVVVPRSVIDKPPSAELRPDQKDQDSLPPYPALDDMLRGLVEAEAPVEALVARGNDPAVVARVQNLLYAAEYKRRQAPPGVKIGQRNFGRDRRYPITNRYRDRLD